ncbi:resistance-nodulation-cell division (RND) divalent metal cation efflux transporter CzcA [Planctomycetales bacterium]|nr:resistance-nodulation-cell division (RND) divalent metal cation efflux transporter CzcA [Planctomycetales bacterium]
MDFLNRIIDFSLRHRAAVIIAVILACTVGLYSLIHLDIDAFPDTTPVQVQINTVAPAYGPEEIERQITFPIEQSISGLRGLTEMRSVSKFGFCQVVAVFDDSVDIYFARQLIQEKITSVELPSGIERPSMGPVATGLGEVLNYLVTGEGTDKTGLRTIHDWDIVPAMRYVPGTAEINTWGGYVKQYQIQVDPDKLAKHKLTFDQVVESATNNNRNSGGGNISRPGSTLFVQGLGRTTTVEQIRQIVITAVDGVPIRIEDIGDVVIGHEIRRGAVTADGKGEAVMGIGFMLMGENSHKVTAAMKKKLAEIEKGLPPNVKIEIVYDRTELVDFVIDTVRKNLCEGGLFVIFILFLFLGNIRAACIVALVIPLSMLFAFTGMYYTGIAASLLSLGALDFGLVVDSSVVMIENCTRKLQAAGAKAAAMTKIDIIREAAVEVRKPTMFGELIIMIVYLPILTLQGVEGKMFRPMALTVIFALLGSMILSLTLMPVLASLFLPFKCGSAQPRAKQDDEPLLVRIIKFVYEPLLRIAMQFKAATLMLGLCVLIVAFGMIAPHLGSEFIPALSEGDLVVGVVRPAGTDIDESIRYNTEMEKYILTVFPDEVKHVWSRIGTAEISTDPMGLELTDIYLALYPREKWTKAKTQAELTEEVNLALRDMPGQRLGFSQPIAMRINELASGNRSDVAIKLFGDDFTVLESKAKEIETVVNSIDGAADVSVEQLTGQPVLQIQIKQDQLARYGINAEEVMELVESIGGKQVGEIIEGEPRFPLVLRLPQKYQDDPKKLIEMPVLTAKGEQIPLGRLASVETVDSPSTINREWGIRRITISANVRGRDIGSFVNEVRQKVAEKITLPSARYRIEYGGQFENWESARLRLLIVVPIMLFSILGLLYLTYRHWLDAVRVFMAIPFAWVGGILALWFRDMPFSVAAAVGFIAMSGVAVLDDMILVSYIRQLRKQKTDDGASPPVEDCVIKAALVRLRPVLMTTLVAALGFLPMAMSTGIGSEVQRPLATVVIGGVISSMFISLFVMRVFYVVFNFNKK